MHDDALLRVLAARAEGYGVEPLRPAFEEGWRQWRKAIGMRKDRYTRPQPKAATERRRFVLLSDLHSPFHEPEMLADFIEKEKRTTDVLIIPGDFADSYTTSRFTKYDPISYREEWAGTTLAMQVVASAFPEVWMILGNHDVRLERQLRTHMTADIVDAIRLMAGGVLCPLTALAKRYPNVRVIEHLLPGGQLMDWVMVVGDAIICHAEKFSKVPGSVLRGLDEWFDDHRVQYGFPIHRLLVQAHTHQLSIFPWRADRILAESGCLAKTQGYQTEARAMGRPQRRGYLWFEQDMDGRTDLNSIGMHCYDFDDRFTG